jgi:hypothetical protein
MQDEATLDITKLDQHMLESGYKRVIQHDGVKTTICENRLEVIATPGGDITEQNIVGLVREWIRWRKDKMRDAGGVPG